ncbi:MAG TPA: 50S ribosomal protein L25 [Acidimicrobiales bacterium]|jgi:large subunit ribosomal protein L25|nr:50S ribosomal protein L25 [Acidimicrobiales bacterium]
MADDIILAAETGRPTGSPASRRLRASGKVPAVIYGRGAEPAVISVDWRELRGALTTDKGLNALLTLKVGNKRTKAIVKELQRHPVRRDVLHVDFLAVDVDKPITTDVPLLIEGEPEKVLREQGVVEQILNMLIVSAKPDDIPGHIAVDVSDLEIGQHITVGDVELPEGVTTEIDPEETIVTAKLTSLALAEEEEEEEAEEAEGEEAAEGEAAAGAEPGEAGSPQGGGEGGE